MKYLIISDLHLGDGTKSDDFIYEDYTRRELNDVLLVDWINKLSPDVVILNGDIYELWQHSMRRIKKSHPMLHKLFNNKINPTIKFIRLTGNHDYELLGKTTHTINTKSGQKILVSHGFQNDKSMTNPFIRFGMWCLGWVEKIIPNIESVERVFKKSSVSNKISENTMDYAILNFNKGYDIVVCGHTHVQGQVQYSIFGNKMYYNSGTCQHGKLEGVLIDDEKSYVDDIDFIRTVRS